MMVLSKFCVLHKASGRELQEQNECIYDQGGSVRASFLYCICRCVYEALKPLTDMTIRSRTPGIDP